MAGKLDRMAPAATRTLQPLSKSRVLSGQQCVRKLWLELHEPDAPELADVGGRRTILWGNRVGELARTYFPVES